MDHVRIDSIEEPPSISQASVLKPLSDGLGTEHVAINYFELEPGDQLGWDYHRHEDQEEVFVVLAGTLTFETETGAVVVDAGEAIRFAPGEFQLGHNRGEERVELLAIGAPRGSRDLQYERECDHCGASTIQDVDLDRDRRVFEITCTDCGTLVDEAIPD